jgi:hypothetical protein
MTARTVLIWISGRGEKPAGRKREILVGKFGWCARKKRKQFLFRSFTSSFSFDPFAPKIISQLFHTNPKSINNIKYKSMFPKLKFPFINNDA